MLKAFFLFSFSHSKNRPSSSSQRGGRDHILCALVTSCTSNTYSCSSSSRRISHNILTSSRTRCNIEQTPHLNKSFSVSFPLGIQDSSSSRLLLLKPSLLRKVELWFSRCKSCSRSAIQSSFLHHQSHKSTSITFTCNSNAEYLYKSAWKQGWLGSSRTAVVTGGGARRSSTPHWTFFCCAKRAFGCWSAGNFGEETRKQHRGGFRSTAGKRFTTSCWCSCSYSQGRHLRAMGDSGKKRVCIVGSGNWGSAIAKIVGDNVVQHSDVFEDTVKMYVFEEMVNGRKLTEIINQDHENVKYLPGHKLPVNIIAVPDVLETAKDADILIFVLPHQFIKHTCKPLVGNIKSGAFGLSLIKGFDVADGGGIELISSIITKTLSIPCNVLMGANLAGEIADGNFSETTIGARDAAQGKVLHKLIQTDNFRVVVVKDVETVELCGALKNVVAVGAGFVDGLQLGDNTKAAIIRLGLMEMVRFTQEFFNKDTEISTFLESCGVADLITTCYGGRNRKVSEAFVKTGKPFEELEKEMLNGQRLQGPMTAAEVNFMLKSRGLEDKFPLFTTVHRISTNELKPQQLIDNIRNHPEHMRRNSEIGGNMKAKL